MVFPTKHLIWWREEEEHVTEGKERRDGAQIHKPQEIKEEKKERNMSAFLSASAPLPESSSKDGSRTFRS